MRKLNQISAVSSIVLALLLFPNTAQADGFGASGDTIPFFVNGGATNVGTWTSTALNVTGGFTATGNAILNGSMTALYYSHTSDLRLKTDIHPINDALNKLLVIRGVEFNWIMNGQNDMGVIAQNVAEVFPSVVHTNSLGIKSVEYDSLVAPIIEALRELKAENDLLSAEIESVKATLPMNHGGRR